MHTVLNSAGRATALNNSLALRANTLMPILTERIGRITGNTGEQVRIVTGLAVVDLAGVASIHSIVDSSEGANTLHGGRVDSEGAQAHADVAGVAVLIVICECVVALALVAPLCECVQAETTVIDATRTTLSVTIPALALRAVTGRLIGSELKGSLAR